MPTADWDNASGDPDDYEYPEPDVCDDDSTDTIACPECGTAVYEDADVCPACGTFIIHDTRFWSGKSLWWIALGFLGIIAVLLALALGSQQP